MEKSNKFHAFDTHRHITNAKERDEGPMGKPAIKGKVSTHRIGRETYDALMNLLAEDNETPTTHHGVFIANSVKRKLKMQFQEIIQP